MPEEILEQEEVKTTKKEKKNKDRELIESLTKTNLELSDKVLRLTAEMQNINRRNEDYLRSLLKYEGESVIVGLLDIVDNFERAINMDDDNLDDEVSKFLNGFKIIYNNLLSILNNNGVSPIECLNTEFDSNFMEAVMSEPKDGVASNIVIEVLQKGYMYKDKCIRYAMVKVSE